ncbi:MAG: HEAT repeat domain-containing protein [Bacillota bacterium]|jgi:HEAT repeat protein
MENVQIILDWIYNHWLSFLQYKYAWLVIIDIIAAIILIILGIKIIKERKKNVPNENPSKIAAKVPQASVFRHPLNGQEKGDIVEPVLPLSEVVPKNNNVAVQATGGAFKFPALAKRLKTHKGILSEKLIAECQAAGADLLPDILAIYDQLDPRVAQNIRDLSIEEGWLVKYTKELSHADKNKETLLASWRIFPDSRVLPQLVELLAHKEESLHLDGVWLLNTINDKRCLPYLVAALLQPQKYLTARVGEVFENFGMSAANLLANLLPEVNDKNKLIILETLSQFSGGYQLLPLVDCLNDSNWELRMTAVRTLGESKYYEAKETVLPLTYDSVWQVRAAAAKTLGSLRVQEARDRLRQLLVDDNFLVRANAKEALDRLELDY